jgi:holliday junction DNA helicase RuvA
VGEEAAVIGFLRGKVVSMGPADLTVDVGGVGYEVVVDRQARMGVGPLGSEVVLWVRTVVREDAITLFGFDSEVGRTVFDLLVSVSGIGPKMGSAILGGFPLPELVEAVREKNTKKLSTITGVGKKTAERLVLELCEKFLALPVEAPTRPAGIPPVLFDDVRSALLNLGFVPRDVESALRAIRPEAAPTLEGLVRAALAILSAR